jgi:hypothetical protein
MRVELLEDRTAPSATPFDWISDDFDGSFGDDLGDDAKESLVLR